MSRAVQSRALRIAYRARRGFADGGDVQQEDDPLDFTNKYNTDLSPSQESAYQNWVQKQASMGANVKGIDYDYDMRGWWAANPGVDLGQGHLTDTFKKPNHPTFSTYSQYDGVDGHQAGAWQQKPDGSWSFSPGSSNYFSVPELRDYFKRVEPSNELMVPES
jgi:hypothetical protein